MNDIEKQFAQLGRRLFSEITNRVADGEGGEWCETIMEEAAKIGLACREPYDPDRYGTVECAPGDIIWSWAHLPDGWKFTWHFINPITRQPEPDPAKCGVLVRD